LSHEADDIAQWAVAFKKNHLPNHAITQPLNSDQVNQPNKIGKWSSVSLVVGNMIGAGIFMTPAVLASYGGISLLGWLMSTVGAVFIAMLFSRLSKLIPNAQGGIYAYTREGLGEFPAFMVSWGYWFSTLTTNAALAVAFISYLSVLIPFVNSSVVTSAALQY
jgi:APA family basic amino acid/polyamine antiporter